MRKALIALLCGAALAWPACDKAPSETSQGIPAGCRQGQTASKAEKRNAENVMAGLKGPGGPSATPEAEC